MFEIKKGEFAADYKLEYPDTRCMVSRDITINGEEHFISGFGKATCISNDSFNEKFGEELSRTKASIEYLKQEKKLLISLTKQPEWRKEKPEKYLHHKGGQVFEVTKEEHEALHSTRKYWKDLINKYGGRRIVEKKQEKPDFKSWGEFTEYLNNLAEAFLKDYKDNTYHLKDK